MGKYENTAKSGSKSPTKGHPVLNPQGVTLSKKAVQTLDDRPKSHNYTHIIFHSGADMGHTAVLDTGSQQSTVGMRVWDIIKRHDTWIDTQGVNMGGSSKEGRRL